METPTKTKKAEDYFILMMPSVRGAWDCWTSIAITQLPFLLQKQFMPMIERGKDGVARARTYMLEGVKEFFDKEGIEHNGTIRVLMFDDDLILDFTPKAAWEIAQAIKRADAEHLNIVANYRIITGRERAYDTNVFMHDEGANGLRFYTDDEMDALEPFQELPNTVSGLGFYYGDLPLDYKFHEPKSGEGEDIMFFRDNKLKLHYAPIIFWHDKKEYIGYVPKKIREQRAADLAASTVIR